MNHRIFIGLLAASMAAIIGSGWQLATRHAVSTTLGPVELALLRYGIPAVMLAPIWIRRSTVRSTVRRSTLALLVIGSGLPFGMLVLAGAQWAPASHMGIFMAGSMPLFTALGAWAIRGDQVKGLRLLGLLCIAFGMIVFALNNLRGDSSTWRGDVLFVSAAILWASYTLAFGQSGLTPWQSAAVVNLWSALLFLPAAFFFGVGKLFTAPWSDIVLQAFGQGVLAGMVRLAVYGAAITRLGAARASLSAALIPVLTTLGGAWLLDESITGGTVVALILVVPGVVMASGAFQRQAAKVHAPSAVKQ